MTRPIIVEGLLAIAEGLLAIADAIRENTRQQREASPSRHQVAFLVSVEGEDAKGAQGGAEPADLTDEPSIGGVVKDSDGDRWTRCENGWWKMDEEDGWTANWARVRRFPPLTLVSAPKPESVDPVQDAVEAIADGIERMGR